MQVKPAPLRLRWLVMVAAWAIAGVLVYLHAAAVRDYVGLVDAIGLRDSAPTTPLRRVSPTMYADMQMWVRHSLALAEGAGPQLRTTDVDNAPDGREVHWNSVFAWLLAAAGGLRRAVTGESQAAATEQVLAWFNLPLLLGVTVGFSLWACKRAGPAAGVFLVFAMVGNASFYLGFSPNYVDHHGLLAAAVLGLVLGAAFMGLGFRRQSEDAAGVLPESARAARRAAIASAACGAVGLWISAATTIPAIAIVGGAGAVALLSRRRSADAPSVKLDPDVWRVWGRSGAALGVLFYLLEYAPFHLGWRLEVNHPVYAAGWWGGSEIIAQIAEWRVGRQRTARSRWMRLAVAIVALSAAPTVIAMGGSKVFVVFDRFVAELNARYVAEGISLPAAARLFGWGRFWAELAWTGAAAVGAGLFWSRSRSEERPMAVFCAVALVVFTVVAVFQMRWWPNASAAQIAIGVLGVAGIAGAAPAWTRWVVAAVPVVALCLPVAVSRIVSQEAMVRGRAVDRADALQPLYRDIAATIRAADPNRSIVLLTSPNASVAIGYYGRFKTVGTLYWENLAGTKAAAEIFSAQSEAAARRLVRDRGITHIAMISENNFLAEYFSLAHPPAPASSLAQAFGYQLLVQQNAPVWLEQLPYEYPADLPLRPGRVLLYRTRFAPPAAEAAFDAANEAFAAGNLPAAETKVGEALALAPDAAELWLARANLWLRRGQVEQATAAVARAVENAEPGQRFAACNAAAGPLYAHGAHAAAADLFQRALARRFDPVVANNLAWLLATSRYDRVRDGALALQIAEKLAPAHHEHGFLNSHAAALAECGRFEDAAAVAAQAVETARAAGEGKLTAMAEARLASYRAGRPWRE